MKLSNLSIGSRLAAAFALVIALLVICVSLAFAGLDEVGEKMQSIVAKRYTQIDVITQIKNNGNKGLLLVGRILLAKTPEQAKKYMDDYGLIRDANAAKYKQLEELLDSDESQSLFKQQADARKDYGAALKKVFDLVKGGDTQQAMDIYEGDVARLQLRYYALIDKMVELQAKSMEEDAREAQEDTRTGKIRMGVISLLALLIAGGTGVFITGTITRPIQRAIGLAEAVARGDLTQRLESQSKDEVGRLLEALRGMTEGLHRIVTEVRQGTDTISTAASEVASGNHDLSARTEQQASSLEETVAAMEELTVAVKHTADNASLANGKAASASAVAVQGGEVVGEVISTMSSIADSSKRIVEIISVIDGIAFQTNILALNAAVEAARAGEQGRGFAVVAAEVRSLAQRSAVAAKEIKTLIAHSSEQVELGGRMVEQAGQTMQQVVASIKQVTDIVAEISASSQEQSAGIAQINSAMAQMDDSTQKNAALVEQGTAAASSLQGQAGQLADVVRTFRLSE
ncbi:MAG: methyl-accepting chemotaxis protein [Burkholderiaceae bacterium]